MHTSFLLWSFSGQIWQFVRLVTYRSSFMEWETGSETLDCCSRQCLRVFYVTFHSYKSLLEQGLWDSITLWYLAFHSLWWYWYMMKSENCFWDKVLMRREGKLVGLQEILIIDRSMHEWWVVGWMMKMRKNNFIIIAL